MSTSASAGRDLPPYMAVSCPDSFDFQTLLKVSTLLESERISAYDNQDNVADENCAIQALHDFEFVYEAPKDAPGASGISFYSSLAFPLPLPPLPASAPTPGLPEGLPPAYALKPVNFSHLRRAKKRKREAEELGQIPRKKVKEKYLKSAVELTSDIDLLRLPATAGAYSAKFEGKVVGAKKICSVQELLDRGFELVCWDGRHDRPLTDQQGLVFGALVGMPQTGGYPEAAASAYACMLEEGCAATFLPQEVSHRRGGFPAINVGITHGKGTLQPVVLDNKQHKPMVSRLLKHPGIRRMAGFASASFGAWAPGVYQYYKTHLDSLFEDRPALIRNFSNSVYPTAAFNLGDQVCTYIHRDPLNCPFGMCSIQPVGNFDHTKGGHLVLWELKRVIKFPSGSLILIPSATITHSNIPVAENETRLSFTQYAPGGLFRYVDYGLRTEKQLKLEDRVLYEEICQLRPERWQMGLGLLSNIKDIQKLIRN